MQTFLATARPHEMSKKRETRVKRNIALTSTPGGMFGEVKKMLYCRNRLVSIFRDPSLATSSMTLPCQSCDALKRKEETRGM